MPLAGLSDPAGGEPGTVGPGAAVDPAGGAAGLAEAAAGAGLPGLRCLGLYRQVLLRGSRAFRGLRHDEQGWQLWSAGSGWQAVQLRPDSLALPWLIVLRVRLPGRWRIFGCCIPADALGADSHRRLRVRLRFSRRRWAAPG